MRYSLCVAANPGSVRRVRESLRDWLSSNWPGDDHDSLVFAVNEAVSNAIEHAYPADHTRTDHAGTEHAGTEHAGTEITVTAQTEPRDTDRLVIVSVTDHGKWRATGHGDSRGRGIMLMRAFTHALTIETSADGTTVTITSRLSGSPEPVPVR